MCHSHTFRHFIHTPTFKWDAVEVIVAYGTDVSGSGQAMTEAGRTRHRTSTITLTSGDRFISHWTSTATDESIHSNSFIIVEVKA